MDTGAPAADRAATRPSSAWYLHEHGSFATACASANCQLENAKEGFVLVDRTDYKVQEIWKVDHINGPTHIDAINLNRGDIIMRLLDRTGKQLVWIRLLRRVGDAGGKGS